MNFYEVAPVVKMLADQLEMTAAEGLGENGELNYALGCLLAVMLQQTDVKHRSRLIDAMVAAVVKVDEGKTDRSTLAYLATQAQYALYNRVIMTVRKHAVVGNENTERVDEWVKKHMEAHRGQEQEILKFESSVTTALDDLRAAIERLQDRVSPPSNSPRGQGQDGGVVGVPF